MTTTDEQTLLSVNDSLRCRVPAMSSADGSVRVETFEIEKDSIENIRLMFSPGGGRQTKPGTYTKLLVDGHLWMSDTDAERRDHHTPVNEARRQAGVVGWSPDPIPLPTPKGRGLVNGLGLGCVLAAMLDVMEHVDVVEHDPRVAELVGGWFVDTYGPDRVTVHVDDAYTIKWPVGTRWDVAWHDIWIDLCVDNLELMAKLHRRYGNRVRWQGSWGKELTQYHRDRDRRSGGFW